MKRLFALAILVPLALYAQDTQTKVKTVSVQPSSPVSGKQMYVQYCAVCHGVDGKGGGPAAQAMKMPPTDLTQLPKESGKFPELRVYASINGDDMIPAHGNKNMPVWGTVFRSLGREDQVKLRLANLTRYIESLQAK